MNDKENLERKESNRYRVLKLFYDEIGDKYQQGGTLDKKMVVRHFFENEGISQEELEAAFTYLINENLLECMTSWGHTIITHSGVKEIEASIKNPQQSTKHFPTKVIQFFIGIEELTMGNKNMRDNFEQINNSQIVSHSKINNSFNKNLSEEKRTLAEAANEIQQLLKQLEESNPDATEIEQIAYLEDETTPSFKRRANSALQAAGETAIDEFILDNKWLKVAKAAIKKWLKPND
jgi:hypothetical protein